MSNATDIVTTLLETDEVDPKDFIQRQGFRGQYQKSEDKFRNRDGSLTNYAFACGYVQTTELHGYRLELWKEGVWHVRLHNHKAGERVFWGTFDRKTDAVKCYNHERNKLFAMKVQESDDVDPKDFAMGMDPDKVYHSIVFFQNDDENSRQAWSILDEHGEQAALEHLASYDYGDVGGPEYEIDFEPWGESDDVYRGMADGVIYVLSYNRPLGYIGLAREEFKYGLPDDQQTD